MPNEFLSQDEVDALLQNVNGEEPPAPPPVEDKNAVRLYNLATQERIVRGRMPTLEIINERFARLLRIGLFNFMRKSPEVSPGPVRTMKYSEFVRNLVVPTNINIVGIPPLRGNALFVFDPELVFLVIDNLFGGDGRFHTRVEGRDFTATEQRIIQRMLEVVFTEYQTAWAPVYPLKFDYVRSEMHTQFANIANPSEIVIAVTVKVEIGDQGGEFHICVPYASVEPIRDLLYNGIQGDQMAPDKRWLHMLGKQVQAAEVDLVAVLSEVSVTLNQVMNFKVGDVLPIDVKPSVVASVDNVPVFRCKHGMSKGQYALRIEEIIVPSRAD